MTDPHNAANPAHVKKQTDRAKLRKEQQDADLKELLAMPQFRRYIWRHMNETCGLMRDPFNPNGSIANVNMGLRAAALAQWAEIEQVDPKLIPQMMLEYWEAQK